MAIPLFVVDAFTSHHFSGNPAAVCPLEHWLDEAQMQAIAAENNLSETAFFVPSGDGFELRWFTPAVEVDLCGHATLATAFVLATTTDTPQPFRFQSKSGELLVRQEGDWFYLDFPTRAPEPIIDADSIATRIEQACGSRPIQVTRSGATCIAEFSNESTVRSLTPDFSRIGALEFRGLVVTAKGDAHDFVSRFFAPRVGINEDPVTGSIHCSLIPYWHSKTGKTHLLAYQASARGGELRCRYAGERVEIGGQAVWFSRGEILL